MYGMDREVAVPERALQDVVYLVDRAIELLDVLQPGDALNDALRGAIDQVRLSAHSLV